MEDGIYRVTGWKPQFVEPESGWSSIFAVYAGAGDVPPMLGSYAVETGALVFRPRFAAAPGVRTRAVFHPPGRLAVEAVFESPRADAHPAARVEHVYPSTDLLPANQLKLYIHFSAPMRRGEAWQRIRLLGENGSPVDLPFLEIDQELWDRDNLRLTVLFDPGRIKRGVLPREEVGPAIEEGKRYTLAIDRGWLDARGALLQEEFRKPFRVGPEDRQPLDPKAWRVSAPRPGATDPLVVDFFEPLDYGLLLRLLEVHGSHGRVAGAVTVARNETQWCFTPGQPWKPGAYKLVIDTSLEDLAGNRIGRPFDVDTFERVSERLDRKTVSLPFRIGRQ